MANPKDPAFLFYPSDFIMGTMRMTYEQKGKYIQLLCMQHDLHELTQSDIDFVLTQNDSIVLSKFVKTESGTYYNQRLRFESDKRKLYSESRRNNRVKKTDTSNVTLGNKDMIDISKSYDEHMVNENVIINTNDLQDDFKDGVKGKKHFKKPTIDYLEMYKYEIKSPVDVSEFYDYYESNGWKVGREGMKDWKATFRNWTRKQKNNQVPQKINSQNQSSYNDTDESIEKAKQIGIIVV